MRLIFDLCHVRAMHFFLVLMDGENIFFFVQIVREMIFMLEFLEIKCGTLDISFLNDGK